MTDHVHDYDWQSVVSMDVKVMAIFMDNQDD